MPLKTHLTGTCDLTCGRENTLVFRGRADVRILIMTARDGGFGQWIDLPYPQLLALLSTTETKIEYWPAQTPSAIGSLRPAQVEAVFCSKLRTIFETAASSTALAEGPNLRTIVLEIENVHAVSWDLALGARLCGLSPESFRKAFQRESGMSFRAFLTISKNRLALREIRKGSSLKEAAWSGGFRSYSAFHESFVKLLGVTPGEYRSALADS